ncbi:MAG: macro domain-containing protein [Planctomycetaceae bacterium]|nr:macro domain-containing protein [Planctomycetaceae bacterium]
MKTQLKMMRADITTVDAEAIVNSANNDLVMGGGVSGAIRRVAGQDVQDECHKIGTVPLGTAVVTSGGLLKARWIIHAAVNPLGMWADAKSVRNATRAVLKRADEKQIKRLAFPALGTGAGALAVERCADILIEEVLKHCENDQTSLEEVMFVLYDEKPFAIFEEKFKVKVLGEAPSPEVADPRSLPEPAPGTAPAAAPAGPPRHDGRPDRRPGGGRRPEPTRRYPPNLPRSPESRPMGPLPQAPAAPPPAAPAAVAPPPPPPPAPPAPEAPPAPPPPSV